LSQLTNIWSGNNRTRGGEGTSSHQASADASAITSQPKLERVPATTITQVHNGSQSSNSSVQNTRLSTTTYII